MKNNITFFSNSLVIILLVLILLGTGMLNLVSPCYAQSPWTTKSPMPTARYVLTSSVVNGKIYAIGGDADYRASVVEAYDPLTNTWASKANMPMGRGGGTSSVVNGRIYYMGGRLSYNGANISSVIEYDATTNTWATKANMMLTPRTWVSSSVVNGKIYAIGGALTYQGAPLSTVEEYDPATDTWTTKADMPTSRASVSTNAVNGKIYAIGGTSGYSQWNQGLSTVEEYDPTTDTWTKKADMPTARTYYSSCIVNSKIYAIGGMNNSHLSSVEEYDPTTDTWTRMADMPTARSGLATSAVNDKIYAIGGWIGGGTPRSTVEEYDPSKDLTGVERIDSRLPKQFALNQNYPNPFNPSTKISYSIPKSCFVILKVYDMLGREVQTLENKFQNAGAYSTNFDVSELSSGIYFYKLQVDGYFIETKKMILLR